LEREPIFIATSMAEIDRAEELLAAEGVAYEVTPEASMKPREGAVCLQGVLFEVESARADECRRVFRAQGLTFGII
jgi:hypothetical protein